MLQASDAIEIVIREIKSDVCEVKTVLTTATTGSQASRTIWFNTGGRVWLRMMWVAVCGLELRGSLGQCGVGASALFNKAGLGCRERAFGKQKFFGRRHGNSGKKCWSFKEG
ncbi:hypothetical protein HPP92_014801 [Vanilla planifolia]|uniref:Uncharacterized protein n=1 Tax=Vanilla planifolia TaxID=51239 RepID=A0A835URF8_VANPL|nr:hypothetical protein HPP92_014801 [Vanilla planifolia]